MSEEAPAEYLVRMGKTGGGPHLFENVTAFEMAFVAEVIVY